MDPFKGLQYFFLALMVTTTPPLCTRKHNQSENKPEQNVTENGCDYEPRWPSSTTAKTAQEALSQRLMETIKRQLASQRSGER